MKRQNLLFSLLALPFAALAAKVEPAPTSKLERPSDNQNLIGQIVEQWNQGLSYVKNKTFLYRNRGGNCLLAVYDSRTGNPRTSEGLYVCYCPSDEALRDLDGGKLPDWGTLEIMPHGSRIQSVGFNLGALDLTPENVDRKIAEAVEAVRRA